MTEWREALTPVLDTHLRGCPAQASASGPGLVYRAVLRRSIRTRAVSSPPVTAPAATAPVAIGRKVTPERGRSAPDYATVRLGLYDLVEDLLADSRAFFQVLVRHAKSRKLPQCVYHSLSDGLEARGNRLALVRLWFTELLPQASWDPRTPPWMTGPLKTFVSPKDTSGSACTLAAIGCLSISRWISPIICRMPRLLILNPLLRATRYLPCWSCSMPSVPGATDNESLSATRPSPSRTSRYSPPPRRQQAPNPQHALLERRNGLTDTACRCPDTQRTAPHPKANVHVHDKT